jgi:hypothetical protein
VKRSTTTTTAQQPNAHALTKKRKKKDQFSSGSCFINSRLDFFSFFEPFGRGILSCLNHYTPQPLL